MKLNEVASLVATALKYASETCQRLDPASLRSAQLTQKHGLVILINLTFYSANTSIMLATKPNFFSLVLSLMDAHSYDVIWLLDHIFADAFVNLPMLVKGRFFSKLTRLSVHRCCNTALNVLRNFEEVECVT
jgi:hypothetical protein